MKISVFQPPYPAEGTPEAARSCLEWMLGHLDGLSSGAQDLILLPEYANAPGLSDSETLKEFAADEGGDFLEWLKD